MQMNKIRRVLWMPFAAPWRREDNPRETCCAAMAEALSFACDQHADPFECSDSHMVYNSVFDEYGIPVHDGGSSYVLVAHCPWCGARLPESQRDRWFDETDALQGEPPQRYLTSQWWRGS